MLVIQRGSNYCPTADSAWFESPLHRQPLRLIEAEPLNPGKDNKGYEDVVAYNSYSHIEKYPESELSQYHMNIRRRNT